MPLLFCFDVRTFPLDSTFVEFIHEKNNFFIALSAKPVSEHDDFSLTLHAAKAMHQSIATKALVPQMITHGPTLVNAMAKVSEKCLVFIFLVNENFYEKVLSRDSDYLTPHTYDHSNIVNKGLSSQDYTLYKLKNVPSLFNLIAVMNASTNGFDPAKPTVKNKALFFNLSSLLPMQTSDEAIQQLFRLSCIVESLLAEYQSRSGKNYLLVNVFNAEGRLITPIIREHCVAGGSTSQSLNYKPLRIERGDLYVLMTHILTWYRETHLSISRAPSARKLTQQLSQRLDKVSLSVAELQEILGAEPLTLEPLSNINPTQWGFTLSGHCYHRQQLSSFWRATQKTTSPITNNETSLFTESHQRFKAIVDHVAADGTFPRALLLNNSGGFFKKPVLSKDGSTYEQSDAEAQNIANIPDIIMQTLIEHVNEVSNHS